MTLLHRFLTVLAIFTFATTSSADDMFYLMTGPPDGVGLQPYTATVYSADTASSKLVEIWDLGVRSEFPRVKLYPTNRLTTIEVGYGGEGECFWMSWDSVGLLHSAEAIEPDISFFGSLIEAPSGLRFQVLVMRPDGPPSLKLLDLSSHTLGVSREPIQLADMRLAGIEPGAAFPSNILDADIDSAGNLLLRDSLIIHDLPSIPDSIIVHRNSYGWKVIANEEAFLVVMSVPDRKGQTHKELLIYSHSDGQWRSLLVPGSHTRPRLFGAVLAGVIADESPDVDYETRSSGPPVKRTEAVIIHPLQPGFIEVPVGKDALVLWADTTEIFYKEGLTIYRARIEKDAIVERIAIVTDQPVYGIKWAFRGNIAAKQ